jgi:hypothetical protein
MVNKTRNEELEDLPSSPVIVVDQMKTEHFGGIRSTHGINKECIMRFSNIIRMIK